MLKCKVDSNQKRAGMCNLNYTKPIYAVKLSLTVKQRLNASVFAIRKKEILGRKKVFEKSE